MSAVARDVDDRPPLLRPPVDRELVADVAAFLAYDAELLDGWRLREWLELWTLDGQYLVPATDRPGGDPDRELFFVRDDWFLLSQRIDAMVNGSAWAESPHSTTSRSVTNVRAARAEDGTVDARANFVIHRSTPARLDVYPGSYRMTLVPGGPAGYEIRLRRATLALVALRPQGRVSIIL